MAMVVRCRDTGADSDFEARADDEEELLKKVGRHAKQVHQMEPSPELVEAVRKIMRRE